MKKLLLFLFLISSCFQNSFAQSKNRIIAYVMGSRLVNFDEDIDVKRLTHINYAFADVIDGEVVEISDRDSSNFVYLNKLKSENPELKILISIGGWGRSGGFSDAVLSSSSREKFANSAIAFMKKHKLDGLDLDWEYPGLPGNGNTHRPEDKQNFTEVLALLRRKLDEMGNYLLTIASASSQTYLDHVEMDKIHQSLDFINIMTYDYFGAWSTETGNHSQLYPSAHNAVQNHLKYGVPSDKLVLGVAFYGRGWKDVEGYKKPASKQAFSIDYKKIKAEISTYEPYWDTLASAPYLYNEASKTLIGYDSPLSMRLKVNYVKENELGGIMFWEYTGDDNGELLGTIYSSLHSVPGHSHNDYEGDEPLTKALNLGLKSIEADVHLINDELYVAHDTPYDISLKKTLEEMYLEPLAKSDFDQYPLYLLIDIKTEAESTYRKLREVLKKYQSKQIVYVISGNRAIDLIANDEAKLMAIDGRPDDVDKNFTSQEMPMISQNYKYFFSSRDPSKIDQNEIDKFKIFIDKAHKKHILVRLWASPDHKEMWKFLENQGVDFINTDDPTALANYITF